jgi:hypothetical protein
MKQKMNPALQIDATPTDSEASAVAKAALRPSLQGAVTIQRYGNWLPATLDLNELVKALNDQANATIRNELGRGEAMLTIQAHTLDAMFNDLARRAMGVESLTQFETYLKLALRAQTQCRSAWETLALMKNPPIASFVAQANIAQGPQQVNNEISTRARPRAEETENAPNELLEKTTHGADKWLDGGTESAAKIGDTAVAPVGEVDRPSNGGR